MKIEDESVGRKGSYLVTAAKGLLVGLVCGAIIAGGAAIIIEGPSSLFHSRSSEFVGFGQKELARVLLLALAIRGAMVGAVLGLIVGLVMAFRRR